MIRTTNKTIQINGNDVEIISLLCDIDYTEPRDTVKHGKLISTSDPTIKILGKICFEVVEKEMLADDLWSKDGSLKHLTCKMEGETDKGKKFILNDVRFYGEQSIDSAVCVDFIVEGEVEYDPYE